MKTALLHYCSHGEQCPLLSQFFRTFRNRVRVWDNGGATFDRYTVAIKRQENGRTIYDVYGMSKNAMSPTGFNQYSHEHNDGTVFTMGSTEKRCTINDLPAEVLKGIAYRLQA